MGNVSIRVKVMAALFVGAGISMIVLALVLRQGYDADVRSAANASIARAAKTFAEVESRDTVALSAAVDVLSTRQDLRDAFEAGDRAALAKLAAPLFADLKTRYGFTHMYFIDATGTVFLRAHKPEQFGDNLQRATYLKAKQSGGYGTGLELGKTAFALRVVRPWYAPAAGASGVDPAAKGRLIGYLELGEEIDHFLDILKSQTGDNYGLLLQKDKLDRKAWADFSAQRKVPDTWDAQTTYVVAGTTEPEEVPEMVLSKPADQIPNGGDVVGTKVEDSGSRTEMDGVFPVLDANGKKVGAVYVIEDISSTANSLSGAQYRVLGVVGVMALALAVVLSLLLNSLVFSRLAAVMSHMEDASLRIAGGDFDVPATPTGAQDEIGKFERFYGEFITMIAGTLKQVGGRKD